MLTANRRNIYMVAEKGGNRVLHTSGLDRRWSLQTCRKGFNDDTYFGTKAECEFWVKALKKHLPHFEFELCKKSEFVIEQVIEGSTYVFRK